MATDYVGGLPAGYLLNEYQIERVLGHGGFGVTYLARDTMLQKLVAIKEFLPVEWATRTTGNVVTLRATTDRSVFEEGLSSFLNEARVLARFRHPNLIEVYRYFQANETAYIVMEYAEGQTLNEVIRKSGSLSEERIKHLLMPVIAGLATVHEAGVLHRDIKPDNILVRPDDTPVLIDFGAARHVMGGKSRSLTAILTPGYAPIEQYSTGTRQGPYTDIYSLGAVMYRAIAGRKPTDATERTQDDGHVSAAAEGRERYSKAFLAAVDWALQIRATDRPQTLVSWREVLEGRAEAPPSPTPNARPDTSSEAATVANVPSPQVTPVAPTQPSMAISRRKLVPVAAVALLTVAAIAVAIWLFKREAIPDEASVGGKYSELLQVLPCPTDKRLYGNFKEWGPWDGGTWCGQKGVAGNWVYVYPNWYVWKTKR